MQLCDWAKRWNLPPQAMAELRKIFGIDYAALPPAEELSEAGVQSRVRLEATTKGLRLWRNNVGATYQRDGSFLRYGLANESGVINSRVKSADLIGIRPVIIQPCHIGATIGQFVSREIKGSQWRYTGTDRERAQLAWAELILSLGGDACFANSEGTL
jgi:hypothetical protein